MGTLFDLTSLFAEWLAGQRYGAGVKILNKPVPPAFKESISYAEQNLYTRAVQLVGDKEPRQHEFTVQLRSFDAAKTGAKLGVASLVALCTSLLKKAPAVA